MPRPLHSSRFDHPKNIGWGVQVIKLPLCSFLHSPVTSSLLGPNILLNTLFSNTLSLRSSLILSDHVSHPYKTTGKIIVLYILLCIFLDSKLEDNRFCSEGYQTMCGFNLLLISLWKLNVKTAPYRISLDFPIGGYCLVFSHVSGI